MIGSIIGIFGLSSFAFFVATIVKTVHEDNTHNRHIHTLNKIKEDWEYSVNEGDLWLEDAGIAYRHRDNVTFKRYADEYDQNEEIILVNEKRYKTYLTAYLN